MKKIVISSLLSIALLFGSVPSAFAAKKPMDGKDKVIVKPLVIMMDFPDYKHNEFKQKEKDYRPFFVRDTYEKDWYQDLFFGKSYELYDETYDSMKTYYEEQSRGKYIMEGGIAGWYTAKNGIKEYGKREQDNAAELVREAIAAVASDPNFDLSEYDVEDKYDYNGNGNYFESDGIIDTIILVHAGRGDEWGSGSLGRGQGIWPFRGKVSWYNSFSNPDNGYKQYEVTDTRGKKFKAEDFVTVAQDSLPMLMNHEFGHTLGLPDIYGPGAEPTRNWSIMSSSYLGSVYATMSPQFGGIGREILQEKLGGDWAREKIIDFDDLDSQGKDFEIGALMSNTDTDLVRVNLPPKLDFVKPFSGEKMYFSQKANDARNSMTTKSSIDLTKYPSNINLTFKTRYDIEQDWDYASVQVRVEGSEKWVSIKGNITTTENPNSGTDNPDGTGRNPGHGITGSTKNKAGEYEWVDGIFDLSTFVGKKINLRFYFWSDGNTPKEGIYIDDIKVTYTPEKPISPVKDHQGLDVTKHVPGEKGEHGKDNEPPVSDPVGDKEQVVPPKPEDTNTPINSEVGQPAVQDIIPPTVIQVLSDTNNSEFADNSAIRVVFSENIQESDAFKQITLTNEEGRAVELMGSIKNNVLTLKPQNPLEQGKKYIVTIPQGAVKDTAGNLFKDANVSEILTSLKKVELVAPAAETVIFFDDAEGADEASLFTFEGFKKDDGVKIANHYYLLEWRNHEGTDRSLKSYVLGNWVEKGAYDPGLVIWYINESLGTKDRLDQDVVAHPGSLSVGVVDADQNAHEKRTLYKTEPNKDYLLRDSAFSLRKGTEMFVEHNDGIVTDKNLEPNPVFNDKNDYTNKSDPRQGLILKNYGLNVYLTSESANRRSATVHIANANKPKTFKQKNIDLSIDHQKNEIVLAAEGQPGYKAHVSYTLKTDKGAREYFETLTYRNGQYRGAINNSIINPKEDWKVNYVLIDGAEFNAPVVGKKMYYSGKGNLMTSTMTTNIDLTEAKNPNLQFKTWYDIEKDWDYASVQVKAEGTDKWVSIQGNITTTDNPNQGVGNKDWVRNPGHGITGKSEDNKWIDATFDLSAFSGKKVELKFEMWTDANTPQTGIYVSDVQVKDNGKSIFSERVNDTTKFKFEGFSELVDSPMLDSVQAVYNSELHAIGTDLSGGNIYKDSVDVKFVNPNQEIHLDSEAAVTVEITNNNLNETNATLIITLLSKDQSKMYNFVSTSKGVKSKTTERLTTGFSIPETGEYIVKAYLVTDYKTDHASFLSDPLVIPVK
ncbi:immune inhibitor A domain-containing protein [Paenibacillus sp. KN14-4R]|uniref:immune inhibitor A domain-containing protein n=1 Tax=Paenibacillus sp. KN14-4R TaxID=3445773 RepID=UPI003F9F229A